MPTVKMTARVSGARNGVDWPAPGETLDVPQAEADDLVRIGLAVLVDAPRKSAQVETAALEQPVETATAPTRKRRTASS